MLTHVRIILFISFIATLLFGLLTPENAGAAGVVGTGTPASCTEAALDAALVGGGVVTFNCGGAATIILTSQKIPTADTTIDGAGQITLSGNNRTRLFAVNAGVRLTLNNITLTAGESGFYGGLITASGEQAQVTINTSRLTDSNAFEQGGAIHCDEGGIMTINASTISGNTAKLGGGLYNGACTMTVIDSLVSDNAAEAEGGAGGGIFSTGLLTVTNSTLRSNSAYDGGGLSVYDGGGATLNQVSVVSNTAGFAGGGLTNYVATLTVTNSLISDNVAGLFGGGVWNVFGSRMLLERTTVQSNSAPKGGGINSSFESNAVLNDTNVIDNIAPTTAVEDTNNDDYGGGGIFNFDGSKMSITNTTISNNQATAADGNGGGIHHTSDETLTLTNVTLSNNSAANWGGGIYHQSGNSDLFNVTIGRNAAPSGPAIYKDAPSGSGPNLVRVKNTAIFGSATNCAGGGFNSLGHNVSEGACASLTEPTDQANVAAIRIGDLADNGGAFPMLTMMPQPGSPLIDAGDPAACPARDQRGAARVGGCDVGAVEFGAILPRLHIPNIWR